MTDNPLDSRREKLVALLYGELGAEDERWIREEIERDEELRSDWEELVGTRRILQKWEVADQAPSYLFVGERGPTEARARARVSGGWLGRLRGLAPATSWAFAAAAVAILALALTDFRIHRSNGMLSIGFGDPPARSIALQGEPDDVDDAVPLGSSPPAQEAAAELASGRTLAPGSGPYITREEFEAYNVGMTRTMIALLNEYDRQREQENNAFLRTAFGGLAERQNDDYRDLRSRIEALTVGMSEGQYRTDAQIDYLMHQNQPGLVTPSSDTTAGGRKE